MIEVGKQIWGKKNPFAFSDHFTYMKRDKLDCIKTGIKYQYVLASSLKLYTDQLHSNYDLLTLRHQTIEGQEKRERHESCPQPVNTLQSNTVEPFLPNQ